MSVASRACKLVSLDASMTAISDDGVAALAQYCVCIDTLKLRKCSKVRREEGLVAVAGNGMLQLLDVSLCRVVSGRLLLEMAACCATSLTELDMSFCRSVQPEAFGFLLDKCKHLSEVRVFGCSQLTQACVHGHTNESVLVVGAPTFEADEAAALPLDASARDLDDVGNGQDGGLHVVQSLAAVSGTSNDSDAMEVI
jgi:DNA repair protein RAD7